MKILVTGASGFVGGHLCRHLVESGHEVVAAVRRPGSAPSGTTEVLVSGLGPDTTWTDALDGCQAVVHLAARVHVMDETSTDPAREFRRANTDATRALGEQARDAGIRRFVYLSSIKAMAEGSGATPLTEADEARPVDPYGISKHQAELALYSVSDATPMSVIVLRPTLIYGPGVGGNLLRLMGAVRRGIPLPLGSVHNRRSMLAVDNLCRIIELAIKSDLPVEDPVIVADSVALSTAEVVRELAAGMKRAPRLVPFPVAALRLAGRVLRRGAEIDRLVGSLEVVPNVERIDPSYVDAVTPQEALRETGRSYGR